MRRGIQFGPEVTRQEKAAKKTFHGRGLLFACYQSSIDRGFRFIQTSEFQPHPTPGHNEQFITYHALIRMGQHQNFPPTDYYNSWVGLPFIYLIDGG